MTSFLNETASRFAKPDMVGGTHNSAFANSEHGMFVGNMVDRLTTISRAAKDIKTSIVSEGEKRSEYFDIAQSNAELRLDYFGLPLLPDNMRAHALIIRTDSTGGSSIEVAMTEKTEKVRRAEKMVLEVDSAKNAKWCRPGNVKNAAPSDVDITQLTPSGRNIHELSHDDVRIGLDNRVASLIIRSGTIGDYTVIRPKPSRSEAKKSFALSLEDQHNAFSKHKKRSRFIGSIAALTTVVAGFVGVSTALGPSENPKDRVVQTADDLVGDPKVREVDGKPQAESRYDEATLSRTREAIEAYMSGDMKKLDSIQVKYNYDSNWVSKDQLQAIENANDISSLEANFNAIFPNQFITLQVAKPNLYSPGAKLEYPNEADLPKLKKSAKAILDVLSTYDKKLLLATSVDIQLATKIEDSELKQAVGATYYSRNNGTTVYLDINNARLEKTAAHEWLHVYDNSYGDSLSRGQAYLNPSAISSSVYVGKEGYESIGTKVGKYTVATRPYGRVSNVENAATTHENWFAGPSAVILDRSVLGEKYMNDLLFFESKAPGSTAKFLSMSKPKIYTSEQIIDKAQYAVGIPGDKIPLNYAIGVFGAVMAMAVAQGIGGKHLRNIAKS